MAGIKDFYGHVSACIRMAGACEWIHIEQWAGQVCDDSMAVQQLHARSVEGSLQKTSGERSQHGDQDLQEWPFG